MDVALMIGRCARTAAITRAERPGHHAIYTPEVVGADLATWVASLG